VRALVRSSWMAVALAVFAATGCDIILGLDNPTGRSSETGGTGASTSGSTNGGSSGSAGCSAGQVMDCYEGPEGTVGVGICKAGSQICLEDRSGFGPCEADVTPAAEDCWKSEDEDCNGFVCSETLWVDHFAGIQSVAIAADRESGAIYIAGEFSDIAQLGVDKFNTAGSDDLFLVKLDSSGKVLWARQLGGMNPEGALSVEYGNHTVTLLGKASGSWTLNGKAIPVGLVVVRYSDDGTFEWVTSCSGNVSGRLAIDPVTDDAVIAGFFEQFQCGAQAHSSGGDYDTFTTRLKAADGTELKTKVWSGIGGEEAHATAVDDQGSVFFAGSSSEPFKIGVTMVQGGMFLAKLAANGAELWAKSFGDGDIRGLAIDSDGNILLAASCWGMSNDFGGEPLPAMGSGDICIAKLGGVDGTYIWARRFGVPGSGSEIIGLRPLSVDSKGNIVLSGSTLGALVIDGKVISTPRFLADFHGGTGALRWLRMFDFGSAALAFSKQDTLAVSGTFTGAVDFGKGPIMTQPMQTDTFALLIAP
jgi:hypothetical protein